jgi:hypothetical protein
MLEAESGRITYGIHTGYMCIQVISSGSEPLLKLLGEKDIPPYMLPATLLIIDSESNSFLVVSSCKVSLSFSSTLKQHDRKDTLFFSSYQSKFCLVSIETTRRIASWLEWVNMRTVRNFPLFQGFSNISLDIFFHLGISFWNPAPGNQDGKFLSTGNKFYDQN